MKFIKLTSNNGITDFINLEKVLTITPLENGQIKILLGAGLYYTGDGKTAALVDLSDNNINNLVRGQK